MSFISVTWKSRNFWKTITSPKSTPSWVTDSLLSWKTRVYCTAYRQLNSLGNVLSRCLSCSSCFSLSLLCSFYHQKVFFLAQLLSNPRLEHWAFTATLAGRGPSETDQFQGLPEAILSCLPSCLKSFLQDEEFSSLRKLLHTITI